MTTDESSHGKQAQTLRLLIGEGQPRQRPRVVAVASGKGGVGKTLLSTSLAVLAARAGERVLIIDGDLALANVHIALGTRARMTIDDVLSGRCSVVEALTIGPAGVRILAAGGGKSHLAQLSAEARARLEAELATLEGEFDVIVVDCGAGIGDNVLFFASRATECILVTNAEPTALADAYATTKVLAQLGLSEIHVVVNIAPSEASARETFGKLLDLAGRFLRIALRYAGAIPKDDAARRALMTRTALVEREPRSRSAVALRRIADELARRARTAHQATGAHQ